MKFTLLIIDDEKNIREGLAANFEMEDYNVKTASNGADGLKLIEKGWARVDTENDSITLYDSHTFKDVDFNDASAPVLELNTGVTAYHPDISPDGKFVAFCTGVEGISGKSKVYVSRLDEGDSTLIELAGKVAKLRELKQ